MLVAALACGWCSSVWRERPGETQAATFKAGASAFQHASFRNGRLHGAKLSGNDAIFQAVQFDGAQLSGATLTAEGAAFQSASFDQSKLAGATLTGRLSSFQQASFAGVDLSGVILTGQDTTHDPGNRTRPHVQPWPLTPSLRPLSGPPTVPVVYRQYAVQYPITLLCAHRQGNSVQPWIFNYPLDRRFR
jgi:uncharacterized protein YjbI with pentapeptide repeats